MSNQLPPVKVGFIIDNVVVDVLFTDERLAAILLSEPKIMDFTLPDGTMLATVGSLYDPESNTFSPPPLQA